MKVEGTVSFKDCKEKKIKETSQKNRQKDREFNTVIYRTGVERKW